MTATASFDYDLCGGRKSMGDCQGTMGMSAGLGLKYLLAANLAVFTGEPVGMGAIGKQFSLSLQGGGPISIDLPLGFMMQPNRKLGVYLSTKLVHVGISNAEETDIFPVDFLPLSLGGLYAINSKMSLTANLDAPDFGSIGQINLHFRIDAEYRRLPELGSVRGFSCR